MSRLVHELHDQATATGLPFEILLLDDASLEEYRNKNAAIDLSFLRHVQLTENIGRCKIRNRLVRLAQYPYLIFMDCDSAVSSPDYLANYISCMEPGIICYGGRIYENKRPCDLKYLRWKYGRARECLPAAQRAKAPNYGFETNNFLIHRSLFDTVQFNEALEGYGHEDTLFGIQLLGEGKIIRHIDNPLIHIGLEDAGLFLQKTGNSIRNLRKVDEILCKNYPEYVDHSLLVRTKKRVDQLRLTPLLSLLFRIFNSLIKKNLLGKHPFLPVFDLYKLGVLCSLENRKLTGEPETGSQEPVTN
jgi:glycosyltransferase involved in cell wall biosynthesis